MAGSNGHGIVMETRERMVRSPRCFGLVSGRTQEEQGLRMRDFSRDLESRHSTAG